MKKEEERTIKSWLRSLPSENLKCRRLGHSWDISYWYRPAVASKMLGTYPWDPPQRNTVKSDRLVVFTCTRCSTERIDQAAVTGDLIRRRYNYAEHYLRSRDIPRPGGAQLNAELFDRIFQQEPPRKEA